MYYQRQFNRKCEEKLEDEQINKFFPGSLSNPSSYDRKPMCCKIYESTKHFAKDCPHKDSSPYVT